MRYYEVLFRYLKKNNFCEDGSPSDEDDYYLIGKVKSSDGEEVLEAISNEDFAYMEEHCDEVKKLFETEEYVEDTLEIVQMLSGALAGHKVLI